MSFPEYNGQPFPNAIITNNFTCRILPYRCITPPSKYLYIMGKKYTSKILVTRGFVIKINVHSYYGML